MKCIHISMRTITFLLLGTAAVSMLPPLSEAQSATRIALHRKQVQTLPLKFEVELVTAKVTSPGEPIILHYKVWNETNQHIGWRPGKYRPEWYTVSITNERGEQVPSIPDKPLILREGLRMIPNPKLDPGRGPFGYIVASRAFPYLEPGQYTVMVSVRTPYTFVTNANTSRQVLDLVEKSATTIRQDFTFPLTVGPPSRSRLNRAAESLRQKIVAPERPEDVLMLSEALSAMPEDQAMNAWRELARDERIHQNIVADGLAKVGTVRAANLIERMQWDKTWHRQKGRPFFLYPYLQTMFDEGNADLRKHIETIYRRHDLKPPVPSRPRDIAPTILESFERP